MGEIYALLSAASFGVAGAAVAKGAPTAKGDNGVFLSIVLTLVLSSFLWFAFGIDLETIDGVHPFLNGISFFIAAGVFGDGFRTADELQIHRTVRRNPLKPFQGTVRQKELETERAVS